MNSRKVELPTETENREPKDIAAVQQIALQQIAFSDSYCAIAQKIGSILRLLGIASPALPIIRGKCPPLPSAKVGREPRGLFPHVCNGVYTTIVALRGY
jgi:hypothetical protein